MAPTQSEAARAGEKRAPAKKRPRRTGPNAVYGTFTKKIVAQVHPGLGIGSKAHAELNSLVANLVSNLSRQGGAVAKNGRKSTLSAKHVQSAVRACLPLELGKFAVKAGTTAVSKFAVAA